MGKKIVPVVVLIAIIAVLSFLFSGLGEKVSAQPGDPAIDFELKDVNGEIHKLSDYKGKPVVINFFATWCGPCIDEAPELEAFGTEYKDAELLVLAKGESRARMEKYISEQNSKLTYLLDTKEEVSKKYSVLGQPETIIIDQKGIIVERFNGPTTKEDLVKILKEKTSP